MSGYWAGSDRVRVLPSRWHPYFRFSPFHFSLGYVIQIHTLPNLEDNHTFLSRSFFQKESQFGRFVLPKPKFKFELLSVEERCFEILAYLCEVLLLRGVDSRARNLKTKALRLWEVEVTPWQSPQGIHSL